MVIFMIFSPPHYLSRVKRYSQLLLCGAPNCVTRQLTPEIGSPLMSLKHTHFKPPLFLVLLLFSLFLLFHLLLLHFHADCVLLTILSCRPMFIFTLIMQFFAFCKLKRNTQDYFALMSSTRRINRQSNCDIYPQTSKLCL